ncbi:MAG: nucleoside-diphosphate kinase [Candidatus Freyarchaeota archaeon]|nr:nucleoside-diphosphate kinase [Candidatus Jordarchaeia archaeon]MBS7269257.1 nucleoside-diphosphate kinase [Candidatus Jordarchaeia archaeon]MBS7280125.1 nucleoside-diphosphate kinase [Candidatus Jordarchaeia archaeon]
MEQSLVLLKPDAVIRRVVGVRVLEKFLDKNFKIDNFLELQVSENLAEKHYAEHKGKPFFPRLKEYIMLSPVVAMVVSGDGIIRSIREMAGATMANRAEPGTIRGDYGVWGGINVIHASDSIESAKREIDLWISETPLGESDGFKNAKKYISKWAPKTSIDVTHNLREACRKLSENPNTVESIRRQIGAYLLNENPHANKDQLNRLRDAIIQAVLEG